jgi:large subunit ribosomal protein L20
MSRSTYGVARHKKKKAIFKKAKGYRGARSKNWRQAQEAVLRAEVYATRDRRKKKGEFRRLWITRISAAAQAHGMNYSTFMNGINRANITVDRKQLSELAIHEPEAFAAIVEQAKAALASAAA